MWLLNNKFSQALQEKKKKKPLLKCVYREYMIGKDLAGAWATELGWQESTGNIKEPARGRERLEISKGRTNSGLFKL